MRLKPGEKAPHFETVGVKGEQISLKELAGYKVLLCFFRYAGCPFCQLTVRKLMINYQAWHGQGLRIVAFFQSESPSVLKYPGEFTPQFPLVADPNGQIYNQYGIESSVMGIVKTGIQLNRVYRVLFKERVKQGKIDGDFFLMPGYFFLNPDLTIQKSYYSDSLFNNFLLEEVGQFVREDHVHS